MPRDLFEEKGIAPKRAPRDVFAERGIVPKKLIQDEQILEGLRQEHPVISRLQQLLQSHPDAANAVVGAAESAPVRGASAIGDYASDFGRGGIQGLGNAAISVANLPSSAIDSLPRIPHINLEKYSTGRPLSALASKGGEIASGFIPGVGAFKALGHLPKAKGWMGLLQNALRGFGAGYATGENSEGEGRLLSGTIGSGLGGISGLTRKGAARSVIGERNIQKQKHGKQYRDIFNEGIEAGAYMVDKPLVKSQAVLNNMRPKYRASFERFENRPSLENAHWAKSDLGKEIRHLEKLESQSGLSSSQIKGLAEMKKAKKNLGSSIYTKLKKSENPDLAERYKITSESYAKNYIPYQNKAIGKYLGGERTEGDFIKELNADKTFKKLLGAKHPEVPISNALFSPLGKAITGGLTGAHLYNKFSRGNGYGEEGE